MSLYLGIDEITIVLQLPQSKKIVLESCEWANVAEELIEEFEIRSDVIAVFGKRVSENKKPAGYDTAYTYGNHDWYFSVGYHSYLNGLGVIVKFSASAMAYYQNNKNIEVYEFLQMILSDKYTQRLSRIDITADFVDEGIDITQIYQDLIDSKIAVYRTEEGKDKINYRKVPMKYNGIIVEDQVETLYIGSPKSMMRMRIYNKRQEQINTRGRELKKAIECIEWIRFEGVFRNEYAHQLTDILMTIQTDDEFANVLASVISQKFLFLNTDDKKPTYFLQMIIDCISSPATKLKSISADNNILAKNIAYIFYGSGVLNTLFKILTIWNEDAVRSVLEQMLQIIADNFKPSDDSRLWLKNNQKDYQLKYPIFEDYILDNLSVIENFISRFKAYGSFREDNMPIR